MNIDEAPLAYAQQHMALEGKLLNIIPQASFEEIQQHLNELGRPPHPMLSGAEENDALIADLNAYMAKSPEAAQADGGFKAVWEGHCDRIGKMLGAYHSLYTEARASATAAEGEQIERSQRAFHSYAQSVMAPMVEELPARLDTFLQSRIEHAAAAAADDTLAPAQRQVAADQAGQWRAAKHEFGLFHEGRGEDNNLKDSTAKNDILNTTLKNVGREDYVASLKAAAANPVAAARVFAGAGLPQGFASYLHFGYTRSGVDAAMADKNFAAHVAATSGALGASHKVVSDGLRPFVQLAVDKTVGLGVKKADALSVYPKALHDVTEHGRRVHRTADQREAVDASQAELRAGYQRAQNAWNFGTVSGDFTGFTAFGAAHAVRDLLAQFTALNADNVHWRALFSGIGGTLMAGTQATAKYLQTHGDEHIPTHTLTTETKGWGALGVAAGKDALKKLNPADRAALSDLAGRILSLGEGVALSTALSQGTAIEKNSPLREKLVHTLATYFQSGLTLQPFFSNNQAPAEADALAKAEGKPKASQAERPKAALNNLRHPDRASLPHTQKPGSSARVAENTIHFARGAVQLGPQVIIGLANAAFDAASARAAKKQASTTDPAGIRELRNLEEGQVPADNTTGEPSTEPS
ncbi:type III effector [Pseudomonas typographi]|uniref:Type III effector n=1 Tax=Pseudomonas typographi TaxID=2715964 RepID=A0ABR7Z041_9PSED|nr:type III effector [Pseudomonas typographi]MBD1550575.1 type III effector [Pseudomonas typographi]MBD1598734.1 type III effector [Pseudomonas typographi]